MPFQLSGVGWQERLQRGGDRVPREERWVVGACQEGEGRGTRPK